jgi:hypothetical protein
VACSSIPALKSHDQTNFPTEHERVDRSNHSDSSIITKQLRNPFLLILGGAVSLGLGGLAYMGYHKIKNDPSLVIFNKKENPYPYLNVKQNENIKLFAVGFKAKNYEAKTKETFL